MKRNVQTVGRTSSDKGNEAWRHSGESSLSKGTPLVGDLGCLLWTKDWGLSAIWRAFFGQRRGMRGNVCCVLCPNETGYAGCMSGIVGSVSLVELNRRVCSANRRKTLARKTQRGACADAVRCDGHRSTLHQASQRTALFEARCRPLGWRVVVGTPEGGGAVLLLARVALLWHLKKTNESLFLPIAKAPCRFTHGQAFVPLLFFFLLYWPLPSLSYSSGLRRLPRFLVSDSRIGIPSDSIRLFPP